MEHSDFFLVYYNDRKRNMDSNSNRVVKFLKKEGFVCAAGYWGCPWYFVDIDNKIFKPGRPGVSYGKVIGNYAITFEEFKKIYSIYKKYNGLEVLKWNK